jgi:hypothetical protein
MQSFNILFTNPDNYDDLPLEDKALANRARNKAFEEYMKKEMEEMFPSKQKPKQPRKKKEVKQDAPRRKSDRITNQPERFEKEQQSGQKRPLECLKEEVTIDPVKKERNIHYGYKAHEVPTDYEGRLEMKLHEIPSLLKDFLQPHILYSNCKSGYKWVGEKQSHGRSVGWHIQSPDPDRPKPALLTLGTFSDKDVAALAFAATIVDPSLLKYLVPVVWIKKMANGPESAIQEWIDTVTKSSPEMLPMPANIHDEEFDINAVEDDEVLYNINDIDVKDILGFTFMAPSSTWQMTE